MLPPMQSNLCVSRNGRHFRAPAPDTGQKGNMGSMYIPLRRKLIIIFCLLITIPFLVIGTITYIKYTAGVERNTAELSYQIVNQININLESYVKELDRLTLMPLYDEEVMSILKSHSHADQRAAYVTTDETNKMNLFISSLAFDKAEIESILIFTNDGGIFSNLDQSVRKKWDWSMVQWMEAVKEKDGGLTILPPHDASYYAQTKPQIVSLSRVIREPYTHKMLGLVKVDLTPEGFGAMLSSVHMGSSSELRITDSKDEVLYAASGGTSRAQGSFIRASAHSKYTGLKVTALISRGELREEAHELTSYTLMVSLIALMTAYAAALVLSNRLTRPIAHLQSKMRQVQQGQLQERAIVATHDEIGQLTEGFNMMVGEIDRLVKEVYETKLKEKEAELSALQNQIQPHFLYNTLEMVNMLALSGNSLKMSRIVTSLAKLLRYTAERQEHLVYIQDEVRFVEAYLEIQELRLGDRLQSAIHIDASYDYCLVPKLILQPLIENVIEHALGAGTVRLTLSAHADGDDLILSVKDDGIGMSVEQKSWLEEWLYTRDHNVALNEEEPGGFGRVKKGLALRNVHQRIQLHYNAPYGLYIDDTAERGVTVYLRLPIQWRD